MALQLAIDCTEPRLLVPFWCEALGYIAEPPPGGHSSWNDYWREMGVPDDELPTDHDAADSIVDPAGVVPRVFFQVVPEPKSVKNRVHLDLKISGGRAVPLAERRERIRAQAARLGRRRGAGGARVEALGATRGRVNSTDGLDHYGVVMQDPEGNEFCVA